MQKLSESTQIEFKMPHLYKDDLEAIEKILQEELHTRSFSIEAGGYHYDSVREIDNQNAPVTELKIETHEPYITINFNKHSANLFISDSEVNTLGAASKIEQIIERRQRNFRWTNAKLATWLSGGVTVIFLLAFTTNFSSKHLFATSIYFVGFILSCIWIYSSYHQSLKQYCKVEFVESINRTSFWIRKKDDVLVAVISTFFGAILGVLGTLFVQTFYIH